MSNQSNANSSRLSMALLDLPLTPFGMRNSHISKNNLISTNNGKSSKLGLKSLRNVHSPIIEVKENVNFSKFENVNLRRREKKKHHIKQSVSNLKPNSNTFAINTNVEMNSNSRSIALRSKKRDSIYTDIDDGSFVEFIEVGNSVPLPVKEMVPDFFYTCSEENESKFSTSSKFPQSPVGFHKFIDKLKNPNIYENITEEVSLSKERTKCEQNFNLDETVITGSRDLILKKVIRNEINIMNSTVNNPKSKFFPEFPDLSMFSLNRETLVSSKKQVDAKQKNKSMESIVLSESDDEYQQINEKKFKEKIHKNIVLESSLISEDVSFASTVPIQKCHASPILTKPKSSFNSNRNILENKNDSFEVDDRLVGWILNSPFKDSSFGTSFVDQEEENNKIKDKYNFGNNISSQSLDLRLSVDLSPGKASGKTVFTLGRVAESPEIEDIVPVNVRSLTEDSLIWVTNEKQDITGGLNCTKTKELPVPFNLLGNKTELSKNVNLYNNSSLEKTKRNLYPILLSDSDEELPHSLPSMKTQDKRKSFSLDRIDDLSQYNDMEYPSAGEKKSNLYPILLFDSDEELPHSLPSMKTQDKRKSFSLDRIDDLSQYNDLEYPSAGELHNSILEGEKTWKPKNPISPLKSKSESKLKDSSNPLLHKSSEIFPNFKYHTNRKKSKDASFVKVQSSLSTSDTLLILESSDDSLPDVDICDHKKNTDLFCKIKEKANINNLKSLKNTLIASNENVNKNVKNVPSVDKELISSDESSDNFENYILSAKKKAKEKEKNIGHEIIDSDFIVSDSEDIDYHSPSPVKTKSKSLKKTNINPYLKKEKTLNTEWRKPNRIVLSSSSESDEEYLPPVLPKTKPKISKRKKRMAIECHDNYQMQNNKTSKSFLSSLTLATPLSEAHPEAIPFIKNFKKLKDPLVKKLYDIFNVHIFDNQLPSSMNIKWNPRMTKTAGYCYNQLDKSKTCGRGARIELSSKVIDAPGRLRDTLVHELCHAASWIISGSYKEGHGRIWKSWAAKALRVFPELPVISRCHSYNINFKYTYKCGNCGYSIGRHSKSLDTERKVCGYCHGKFELIVNYSGKGSSNKPPNDSKIKDAVATPQTPRTPNPFALFVKDNYGSVKRNQSNLKHKDVMKVLSEQFARMKTSKN